LGLFRQNATQRGHLRLITFQMHFFPAPLTRWCQDKGVHTLLSPAHFEGGLRGMAAQSDLEAGSVVMSIPCGLLITATTAAESDLVSPLLRGTPHVRRTLAVVDSFGHVCEIDSPLTAVPQRSTGGNSLGNSAI
jgi:hypothetical protein